MTLKQFVNLVRGKKLALKKEFSKTIFYKQTQAKLSHNEMELCGGENAFVNYTQVSKQLLSREYFYQIIAQGF